MSDARYEEDQDEDQDEYDPFVDGPLSAEAYIDVLHERIRQLTIQLSKEQARVLPSLDSMQAAINEESAAVLKLLLAKNREYGGAAFRSDGIFSSASPQEKIKVRIDDKLMRIREATHGAVQTIKEDTMLDLIGYLLLLRVADRIVPEVPRDANEKD